MNPHSPEGVVEMIRWRLQSSSFQQQRQRPSSIRSCPGAWHSQQRPSCSVHSRLSSSLVPTIRVRLISPTRNIFFKPTLFYSLGLFSSSYNTQLFLQDLTLTAQFTAAAWGPADTKHRQAAATYYPTGPSSPTFISRVSQFPPAFPPAAPGACVTSALARDCHYENVAQKKTKKEAFSSRPFLLLQPWYCLIYLFIYFCIFIDLYLNNCSWIKKQCETHPTPAGGLVPRNYTSFV